MKHTGIVRNIDELGRLVVPKEMRTSLGIGEGEPVEISMEDDKIILSKYSPYCTFCRNQDGLSVFKGKKICSACLEEMKKI